MAKIAHSTSAPAPSRRRLAAGLLGIAGGTVLTSGVAAGVAASVPVEPDAELIALCDQFCRLETAFDAASLRQDEHPDDPECDLIIAASDKLLDRIIDLPCASLAGVQAMARALAAWDRELLTDAPAQDAGELLTSHLVDRLLALPSGRA